MEISIKKVVTTLLEAIALVFCVMYLFMQNFRATLIPTLVVPVALLGTLGVMLGLGYSINVLTMFGMVLAIGILVDDAIVVVENVERIMAEEGLSPHDATVRPWARSAAPSSASPWCWCPCSCRWPSSTARWAISTVSSRSRWRCRSPSRPSWRCRSRRRCAPPCCGPSRPATTKRGFFGWFNRAFVRLTAGYTARVAGVLSRPVRFGRPTPP